MKTVKVQIEYDENKYQALERYAVKNERSMEAELVKTIESIYEEIIPKDVREYIEEMDKKLVKKVKKKPQTKAREEKSAETKPARKGENSHLNESAG